MSPDTTTIIELMTHRKIGQLRTLKNKKIITQLAQSVALWTRQRPGSPASPGHGSLHGSVEHVQPLRLTLPMDYERVACSVSVEGNHTRCETLVQFPVH